MKQLLVISLDGRDVSEWLLLEGYCVDSYIKGNRVFYNNFYNDTPFIIIFLTCGIAISLVCYLVKVVLE